MTDTEKPCWVVHAIADTHGNGSDFAYTEGLDALGKPELHLWQRPTHGLDPGADFALSMNDVGALLNRCAGQLLAGELDVGSSFTEEFDNGTSFGRFTVGDPVLPAEVEAHQLAPDTAVLPVRWELVRPPAAAPRRAEQAVHERIAEYSARLRTESERIVDSIELYLPYLQRELLEESRMLHSFARTAGRLADLERCGALAASDARVLLEHGQHVLDDLTGVERTRYKSWLHQGITQILSCSYGGLLLDDVLIEGSPRVARNITDAELDRPSAEQRFWELEGTTSVRDAAALLTDGQMARLADTIHPQRRSHARAKFMEALWWASAVIVADYGANPTNEGMIGERAALDDEPWNWAACVVTGAAYAAVLNGRNNSNVSLLREPWQEVVG